MTKTESETLNEGWFALMKFGILCLFCLLVLGLALKFKQQFWDKPVPSRTQHRISRPSGSFMVVAEKTANGAGETATSRLLNSPNRSEVDERPDENEENKSTSKVEFDDA